MPRVIPDLQEPQIMKTFHKTSVCSFVSKFWIAVRLIRTLNLQMCGSFIRRTHMRTDEFLHCILPVLTNQRRQTNRLHFTTRKTDEFGIEGTQGWWDWHSPIAIGHQHCLVTHALRVLHTSFDEFKWSGLGWTNVWIGPLLTTTIKIVKLIYPQNCLCNILLNMDATLNPPLAASWKICLQHLFNRRNRQRQKVSWGSSCLVLANGCRTRKLATIPVHPLI